MRRSVKDFGCILRSREGAWERISAWASRTKEVEREPGLLLLVSGRGRDGQRRGSASKGEAGVGSVANRGDGDPARLGFANSNGEQERGKPRL
ncbi:hypothetical protein KFK09_019961 [Dendrobium nobile]|uniref:Uncharacterized protein n=1 Tax=Dendrobium nobile TaxID=94219 RepID=A0A8T3ASG4_DENNO|nr:hypothetical protein KFK09_019961 [Dendrobium nobile]